MTSPTNCGPTSRRRGIKKLRRSHALRPGSVRFLAARLDGILVETKDLEQALPCLTSLRVAKLKEAWQGRYRRRVRCWCGSILLFTGGRDCVKPSPRWNDAHGNIARPDGRDTGRHDGEDLAEVAAILGCSGRK